MYKIVITGSRLAGKVDIFPIEKGYEMDCFHYKVSLGQGGVHNSTYLWHAPAFPKK